MSQLAPTPERRKPTWRPGTFRAMRHRNYLLYFVGQVVSLTGSWMQTTAVTWLAYEATDRTTWAALISVSAVLPTLLLAVPGGGLADRWPRRPLIFLAQSAMLALSLVLAVLIAWGATPTVLLVVLFLTGAVMAIDTPARLAFVIEMVGREDLPNAIALNSMVFNTARLFGPGLAALLLSSIGAVGCVLVNAASFVAVLAALLAMRLPPAAKPMEHRERGSLLDGFRHVARRRGLLLTSVMGVSLAFFGWPLLSMLPALATDVVGREKAQQGFSWMTSAVGGGALLGALVVASFATRARRLSLTSGVAVSTAALVGLAFTESLVVALAWCAASGAGLILYFAAGQAEMQLGAGEHNRGRVMGTWLTVLAGAQPAGNLVFGYLSDVWDVRSVLMVDAAGIIVTAAVVSVLALWPPRTSTG